MSDHNPNMENIRHTLAHLLARAALDQHPTAKLTIGPATEHGFYYDIDFDKEAPRQEDLKKLQKKMIAMVRSGLSFTHREVNPSEARELFSENHYKREIIDELERAGEAITLYTLGAGTEHEFIDLCRGGHVETTSEINPDAFELSDISGAYWRGDEKNQMLTRISGLAFETKEALEEHKTLLEEARKRDHRRLGRELDLFTFSDLVGPGLPLYTPKGTILRDQLLGYSSNLQKRSGFEPVWIPHITKTDLYQTSGHYEKFGDELMRVSSQQSDEEFAMKPMNCPHHTQIYASQPRSYRDLPIRYMENTTVYRDERTGELSGLTRVRSLTQDDAHVFCTMEQIEEEFENIMAMIAELYGTLGLSFYARLSFHDPEHAEDYLGNEKTWEEAEKTLERVTKKLKLDYAIATGEAAFYGPKIDIMVTDALGRQWQCATEQLDFNQPERFELEYTAADGSKQTPVMIHKALLGTIDRFLGLYIEHTGGAFPFWLAPVQAAILPVSNEQNEYAQKVHQELKERGLRVEVYDGTDTLGKKIREGKKAKLPYLLVVGGEEEKNETISVESRDEGKQGAKTIDEFLEVLVGE